MFDVILLLSRNEFYENTKRKGRLWETYNDLMTFSMFLIISLNSLDLMNSLTFLSKF